MFQVPCCRLRAAGYALPFDIRLYNRPYRHTYVSVTTAFTNNGGDRLSRQSGCHYKREKSNPDKDFGQREPGKQNVSKKLLAFSPYLLTLKTWQLALASCQLLIT